MNLLIVGTGKGSWTMRGLQLGAALGAKVTSHPTERDIAQASLVVLVKRAGVQWAAIVRRIGRPIVWDALDFWSQPRDNKANEHDAGILLARQLATIKPTLTIGATEAMATACQGVCLPHHTWKGLVPTPAREKVEVVAYDGNREYLGQWKHALEEACGRRGWRFVVSPPDLSTADILVAFRDGWRDGWICREWKSGVKVGNAMAAGRPLISQASAAVREMQPAGTVIESVAELGAAFDQWVDLAPRAEVVEASRPKAPALTVEAIAQQYRQVLGSLVEVAA